jgi:hypothetical protein
MAVAATARTKSPKGSEAPGVVSVYRTLDGGIHHARCHRRLSYRGTSGSGLELEFHCATCHERVVLPEIVAARLPVATSGAA